MSSCDGVLFDLFETLVTESGTRPLGAASLGARLGLDPLAFREHWRRRRAVVTLGQLPFVQAIADIGMALGAPIDDARLEALRQERIVVKAAPLMQVERSVLDVLDTLRRVGKRVGVVSNCMAEDVMAWSESPLAGRVDRAVFSFEVGVAKPNAAIYREATRLLGIAPAAAVFVGDGADDELAGATRAGLRAFRAEWFLARRDHYRPVGMRGLQSIDEVPGLFS